MNKRFKRVIDEVGKLDQMQLLRENDFAEEGGYADEVIRAIGEDKQGNVKEGDIEKALKPTQLRKVFSAFVHVQRKVRRTGAFDRSELIRIMPELAYATGRGYLPPDFFDLLKVCMDAKRLKDDKDFLKTFDFLKAILAYHKYRSAVGYPKTKETAS